MMESGKILLEAEEMEEYMSFCRREIHGLAETGFDTEKTLAFMIPESTVFFHYLLYHSAATNST